MSSPTPSPNHSNASTPSFQRVAIAVGTLVVVILTVAAALFLAFQDLPIEEEPTSTVTAVAGPLITPTNTPILVAPSPTFTPLPPDTPTASPIPVATQEPELPPTSTATATNTPLPPTATSTSTSAPVAIITATPIPATPGACQPPASWVSYEVQRGDTLNSLAARTNSSVFELNQVNCLESFTLQVGQVIYLPFTPPTPTVTDTPSPTRPAGPTPTRTPTPIAPIIETVSVQRTSTDIIVIVEGRNFRSSEAGFRAELVGPTTIVLHLGEARTSTSFEASAPIPADLPDPLQSGAYDLLVVNPSGRLDVEPGVFPPGTPTPVPPAPSISLISPRCGLTNSQVTLTITGSNFRPKEFGFKVELQLPGEDPVELDVDEATATSSSFKATIAPGQITQDGKYDLLVTNSGGQIAIRSEAYESLDPVPAECP